MKILFVSFFNSSNIGDVTITRIIYNELKARGENFVYKMDVSGSLPVNIQKNKSTINLTTHRKKFYSCRSFLSAFKKTRTENIKHIISNVDVVLFAGGNMVMELEKYPHDSVIIKRMIDIAIRNNKKVVMSFVGVGPINSYFARKLWTKALEKCSFVSVRDSYSYEYLKKTKIKKSYCIQQDPVFGLCNLRTKKQHTKKQHTKNIAINVYLPTIKNQERVLNSFQYIISRLVVKFNIVLFVTEKNDAQFMYTIKQKIGEKDGVSYKIPNTLEDLLHIYNDVDMVISTRMHSMIIAITQGLPIISMVWQDKIRGVIKDLHLNQYSFEIEQMYKEKNNIVSKVYDIFDKYQIELLNISKLMQALSKKHKKNFDELYEKMEELC